MNILYIADPNSIHDVRWINFFALKGSIECYVIFRKWHLRAFDSKQVVFDKAVNVLGSIEDPSTIRPWRNWMQVYKIRKIIKEYNISIVHILYAEPNALWSNWKRMFKVAIVITTRGTDILQTIPRFFQNASVMNRIIRRSYRSAFENADFITCTSKAQVESLRKLEISHRNAIVVRTGVDFELLKRAGKSVSTSLGIVKPFVLMPRNMSPVYYHEFTIDAISLLDPLVRRKYSFVFINSDTNMRPYFERISKKTETVDARLHFIPSMSQNELWGLLTEASLVVMNPRSDGSPVSAMEAMACRAPLILPPLAYDSNVFGDVFMFNEWTPLSLRDKIHEVLLMQEEELSQVTEKNFRAVLEDGNTAVELNKVFDLYDKVTIAKY